MYVRGLSLDIFVVFLRAEGVERIQIQTAIEGWETKNTPPSNL